MSPTVPTTLPVNADLYLFSYAKSLTPLVTRLSEVAIRASAKYGAPPAALVVPIGELDAYLAAQAGEEETYNILPSSHLGAHHIGALASRR